MAGTFYVLTVYAAFTNCIINPVIYSIQYKPFQRQVVKLCCKNIVAFEEKSTVTVATVDAGSYVE